MTMMVRCKECGYEHPSAIQIDKQEFREAELSDNSEPCLECGKMSTYNKNDYYFV